MTSTERAFRAPSESRPRRLLVATAATALLGLTGSMLLGTGTAQAAAVDSASTPSTSAAALIDSIGVNVHTYYNDTSYADNNRVITLLKNLGVRHVRDGLAPNRPDQVSALQALARNGIRSELILGGTAAADTQSVDASQLSELKTLAPSVDAVEPTNEDDCSGDGDWATHQKAYAHALVNALQADTALRQLGILGSSFCRPDSGVQYGSVTGTASVNNAHDYAGSQAPELALEGRLPAWSQTADSSLPMVVTETGYQNALNAPNSATEATAADYTVRALLTDLRLGVPRTYLYELLDEKPDSALTDPEQHFGLVRADGSVKPAYTAVQNLLADVALGSPADVHGAGGAATGVTLSGGGSLLRSLTVTDPSGGGQTVALWLARPVESTSGHSRLADPAVTVRLSTGSTSFTAAARQPSRGNASSSLGSGTAFDVPVDGAVTLVHLAPGGGAATTSCVTRPGYAAQANKLGATVSSDLAAGSGWTGSPSAAGTLPAGAAGGAEITGDGQQRHLDVSGSPTAWTIALWERTASGAANFATFLHATNASGVLMRTYDTASDLPSHVQLSGYGAPAGGSGYGGESFGQALPGSWHLLTLTSNGSQATFAVDGVAAGSVPSGAFPLTGVDVGSLGAGFRGALTGLAVFPTALSGTDVASLATAGAVSC